MENVFKMGKIDTTIFIKTKTNDMLLVQLYVDDIIFGATNVSLCEKFAKCIHSEFEMSMMGDLLKRFNMEEAKTSKGRNLHQSSKVYKRSSQKVQHGGSQNNEDSNELIHQA